MKRKIFGVVINFMLFWIISDIFSGIEIKEGITGYIICGGLFGIIMLIVVPLIRFFTLPVKFITILLISLMLSVIIFFLMNVGVPYIDFKDGGINGFSNIYFEFPEVELNMVGNVLVGGVVSAVFSSFLKWLENESRSE